MRRHPRCAKRRCAVPPRIVNSADPWCGVAGYPPPAPRGHRSSRASRRAQCRGRGPISRGSTALPGDWLCRGHKITSASVGPTGWFPWRDPAVGLCIAPARTARAFRRPMHRVAVRRISHRRFHPHQRCATPHALGLPTRARRRFSPAPLGPAIMMHWGRSIAAVVDCRAVSFPVMSDNTLVRLNVAASSVLLTVTNRAVFVLSARTNTLPTAAPCAPRRSTPRLPHGLRSRRRRPSGAQSPSARQWRRRAPWPSEKPRCST